MFAFHQDEITANRIKGNLRKPKDWEEEMCPCGPLLIITGVLGSHSIPEAIPGAVIWNQPLKTHLKVLGLNALKRTEKPKVVIGWRRVIPVLKYLQGCYRGRGRSFVRTQALNPEPAERSKGGVACLGRSEHSVMEASKHTFSGQRLEIIWWEKHSCGQTLESFSILEISWLNLLVTVCDIQLTCFIWDLVFVCLGFCLRRYAETLEFSFYSGNWTWKLSPGTVTQWKVTQDHLHISRWRQQAVTDSALICGCQRVKV